MLYGMLFIFYAGMTWGETISEASFLRQVGVKYLSLVFLAHALVSIISTSIYSAFVDRIHNDRLLIAVSAASVIAIGFGVSLLEMEKFGAAYLTLYVLARVIRTIFILHWWTYVNGFYDTQSSKRIVPVLSSSSRLAIITAGLTVPLLTSLMDTDRIMLIWISSLVIVSGLVWLMPRLIHQQYGAEHGGSLKHASHLENIREGFRYVSRSVYLRWMAVSTFILVLIFALLNYQAGKTMLGELHSVRQLSIFIGQINALAGLIMLPVQMFLFSRIVSRIGVGTANLIYPAGTLVISGLVVAFPVDLTVAALAYFDRTTFRFDVRETSNNLLYNAVPQQIKGRARAFIEGGITPLGLIVSSLLLIVLQQMTSNWALLSLLGLLAVAYMATSIILRRQYSRALITMLEQEDLSVLLSLASDLTIADSDTMHWLRNKLNETTSSDLKIFIAKIIKEVGGSEARPILEELSHSSDTYARLAAIELLSETDSRNELTPAFWERLLDDPDPRIRRAALAGLQQWRGEDSSEFLEAALECLRDLDMEVRAAAIPPLIHSGDLFYMAGAVQELVAMLNHADPAIRAQGVQVSSKAGDARTIRSLVNYLDEESDDVRLQALVGIEALLGKSTPPKLVSLVADKISMLMKSKSDRIRLAVVRISGKMNQPAAHTCLLDALTDPASSVRQQAVQTLSRLGTPMIPSLVRMMDGTRGESSKMAAVTLTMIQPSEYGPRLETYLQSCLQEIYQNHIRLNALTSCGSHQGIALLKSTLLQRNQQLLTDIFDLLRAKYAADTVRVVSESLKSDNQRVRANAIEALESLTTPQTAKLIAALFDVEQTSADLGRQGMESLELVQQDTAQTIRELLSRPDDSWLRAVMIYALAEIGAALPAEPSPAESSGVEQSTRRTARRNPLDLLTDKLTTSAAPSPAPASEFVFSLQEIKAMVLDAMADESEEVQAAAQTAMRLLAGPRHSQEKTQQREETMLSTIEKVIFLKEVPFFQNMTVDQLKALAAACEEQLFAEDERYL